MVWNWEQKDWPNFTWDTNEIKTFEEKYLYLSGKLVGSINHLDKADELSFATDLMASEAVNTSLIEGEILNRNSVQASIRRNFGLETDSRRVEPAESGIADMMTDLYTGYDQKLTQDKLYQWHRMLTNGRTDLRSVGQYRSHNEPMQVVSGPIGNFTIHFEAPPSTQVRQQMKIFLSWYNKVRNQSPLINPLSRSAITHLYFVSIHPFEDGNGRLARALSEKTLSEDLGKPTLTSLAFSIGQNRDRYYKALEFNNKKLEITDWIIYFAETLLKAQQHTMDLLEFIIEKTKLYDRVKDQLNKRQQKVIDRIFQEGLTGFKGGLSAENYIKITGASRATATRDLQDLTRIEALYKTGELKSTRYHLNIKLSQPTQANY